MERRGEGREEEKGERRIQEEMERRERRGGRVLKGYSSGKGTFLESS